MIVPLEWRPRTFGSTNLWISSLSITAISRKRVAIFHTEKAGPICMEKIRSLSPPPRTQRGCDGTALYEALYDYTQLLCDLPWAHRRNTKWAQVMGPEEGARTHCVRPSARPRAVRPSSDLPRDRLWISKQERITFGLTVFTLAGQPACLADKTWEKYYSKGKELLSLRRFA